VGAPGVDRAATGEGLLCTPKLKLPPVPDPGLLPSAAPPPAGLQPDAAGVVAACLNTWGLAGPMPPGTGLASLAGGACRAPAPGCTGCGGAATGLLGLRRARFCTHPIAMSVTVSWIL